MENKIYVIYPIDIDYWNYSSIKTFKSRTSALQYKHKHKNIDVYRFLLVDNYIVKVTKL